MPSPFTSPTATENGSLPTAGGKPGAGANVPSPAPSRTLTLLEPMLAVTRSGLPSPFTSPTATEYGVVPTAGDKPGAGAKAPLPLPSRTLTVPSNSLAETRSGRPSPFTSPTATETGMPPTPTGDPAASVKSPPPRPLPALSLMSVVAAMFRPRVPKPVPESTETV